MSVVTIDDLQALYEEVLRSNPLARSDTVFAMKLFRRALREHGAEWENAAFDRCFDSIVMRVRRAELSKADPSETDPPKVEPPKADPPKINLPKKPRLKPEDEHVNAYEDAKKRITEMVFADGKGILKQTVGNIGKLGSWAGAILRALPSHAKTTDLLEEYLSLDQVTRLRTFQ